MPSTTSTKMFQAHQGNISGNTRVDIPYKERTKKTACEGERSKIRTT
jgi:hypothetical protein